MKSKIREPLNLKIKFMRKTKKQKAKEENRTMAKIKVQLDSKTIIFLRSMQALKNWLVRYPEAKVIS